MPSFTEYARGKIGATHYIKPIPELSSPSWGADVTSCTTSATGQVTVVAPDDTKSYWLYEQLGGSPASSDVPISKVVPDLALAEIQKVPRANAAIAAGAAVQKTLGNDFTNYIQETVRKVP